LKHEFPCNTFIEELVKDATYQNLKQKDPSNETHFRLSPVLYDLNTKPRDHQSIHWTCRSPGA